MTSCTCILQYGEKKENRDLQEFCIRRVIRDENKDLQILRREVQEIEGTWRIYKTVNARKADVGMKNTICYLIQNPHNAGRVDSVWKTQLMKPACKAERKFLLDIDSDDPKHWLQVKKDLVYRPYP